MTRRLEFTDLSGTSRAGVVDHLVVAGYTGSNGDAVQQHIHELELVGIAPPESVPTFYELDASLLTQEPRVDVYGGDSSGEVEPTLLRLADGWFVGLASDHTDRALEREDVAASKAACGKPLGRGCIDLASAAERWDDGRLRSWVDDVPYQDAPLASIRRPDDILRAYGRDLAPGSAMLLGTVPLLDGFRFGAEFRGELEIPGFPVITCHYTVADNRKEPA